MKKKKLFLGMTLGIVLVVAVGCGNSGTKKDASSSSMTSSSTEVSSEAVASSEKADSIVYTAVVKADSNSEVGQILVEKLTPVDAKNETPASFKDEVVLLTDGSNVLNEGKEKVSLDDIKTGATLEVTLAVEPISTMSMPPQIPGRDVYEIVVK
ncbi:hypothetical protein ACWOFR_08185 [Carnobacterium gallinarum]|uniref:hypothetical protein n=1 Tax=Carnobacterium gallinarum TaxID=2749 RepID=UPI000554301E|nr:hypothetical protein [Carnobacterium gallinarum]